MRTYLSPVADSRRWHGFVHRPGDIVISTPSKAGTTWTQMLISLLAFDGPDFPDHLGRISPWLDADLTPLPEVLHRLEAQTHRRFIKTHVPLDGLPLDDRVTYVVVGRDPRDVRLSMGDHGDNFDLERVVPLLAANLGAEELERRRAAMPRYATFGDAVAAPPGSCHTASHPAHVLHHLRTGWDRQDQDNVVLLHYADLRADVVEETIRLARALGFEQDPRRIRDLAAHSDFARMRARADQLAPEPGNWRSNADFFRSARMRAWAEAYDDADLRAYDARVQALYPDEEFLSWVHGGRADGEWRVSPGAGG